MTHPAYLREKARRLRIEKRLTLDEIAERLALPKTTVWYWISDLPIERTVRQTAVQRRATRSMQRKYRELRVAAYDTGRAEFVELSRDATFRDFVCLYIAEGSKRSRNTVAIANSDRAVILVADRWVRRFTGNKVDYWLQYHADQDLDELVAFWAAQLAVDYSSIRLQRKSNSGQLTGRSWRSQYGVLTIRTCDTLFRARLQGWIESLQKQWLNSPPTGRGEAWYRARFGAERTPVQIRPPR